MSLLTALGCFVLTPADRPVFDVDEDGLDSLEVGGTDCDDTDAEIGAADTWWPDNDSDGYGNEAVGMEACDRPSGHVDNHLDCDDDDPSVHPGVTESCDADDIDEDCDGAADDADREGAVGMSTWYRDADGDGSGNTSVTATRCDQPEGWVESPGDCDDGNAAVHPDALEQCDGTDVDEDCDGVVDETSGDTQGMSWWYLDADGDGYGTDGDTVEQCDAPEGYVAVDGDCADDDGGRHPGADEVCDDADLDEDCDGYVDDADDSTSTASMTLWYADADGDGHGDADDPGAPSCSAGTESLVASADDCDDGDASVYPGALEVCDDADVDEDCDGLSENDDLADASAGTLTAYYRDDDGDGYGEGYGVSISLCDPTEEWPTTDGTDCDDSSSDVHPGATEIWYDGTDQDCDGASDYDADLDGYDDEAYGGSDCDDADVAVHVDATESCADDADNDCDGTYDCAASSCQETLDCMGDLNHDGVVDELDWTLLTAAFDSYYGVCDTEFETSMTEYDFDQDGCFTFSDLVDFVAYYSASSGGDTADTAAP